jgi:2-polyprenyl-3-methyl-5-hydroxy-6-metoxy-1,4-benzoquinol methylase
MADKKFGKEYFNSGSYKNYKKEAERWVPKTAKRINKIIGRKEANPAPQVYPLGALTNCESKVVANRRKSKNILRCGARILDVGCAHGYLIAELQNKFGHSVQGIDYSPYAVKNSEKSVRKKITRGDILRLPFRKNEFDVVICLDVINYLEKKDIPKAVKNLANITKEYIFFGAIFKHSWTASQKWNPDKFRKSVLAKKEYIEMFKACGARFAGSFDGENGGSILVFKE